MSQHDDNAIRIGYYPSGNLYNADVRDVRRRMVYIDDLVAHIRAGGRVVDTAYEPGADGYEMTIVGLNSLFGTNY